MLTGLIRRLQCPACRAVGHITQGGPGYQSRPRYVCRVFHLSLQLTAVGDRSTDLVYRVPRCILDKDIANNTPFSFTRLIINTRNEPISNMSSSHHDKTVEEQYEDTFNGSSRDWLETSALSPKTHN